MHALSTPTILLIAIGLANGGASLAQAQTAPTPGLEEGFRNPPDTARPRVWWHWMNGNISHDGIAKDLAWMKRIGIGGVQNFDANIGTPQVVDKRLIYMTPEWKEAFRFAAATARDLDLELAVAASPGWSETGGPWVKPEEAMKKLVWSETELVGGRRYSGKLPPLPHVAGPWQDLPKSGQFGGTEARGKPAAAGGDIGVFAHRLTAPALPLAAITNNGADLPDANVLRDGLSSTRARISMGTEEAPGSLEFSFATPQPVHSATLLMPGQSQTFNDAPLRPRIEVQEGQSWRPLAEFPLSAAATTVSFPQTTASRFRILFAPNLDPRRSGIIARRHPRSAMVAEAQLSSFAQVDQFEAKSGIIVEKDYHALPGNAPAAEQPLQERDVIDLTSRLSEDGILNWTPPKGRWRVVRLGWSLTGTVNHPAPPEATGLEVDKYDRAAVRRYLETYLGMYRAATGDGLFGKSGLRALLTDSTEIGPSNWTPKLTEQFKRLRGYDPAKWMPTLAGIPVGTRAQSDAFLFDYRRTLADLHASEHYGTIADVARELGLKYYSEALEGGRPTLGDDMTMRKFSAVPMSAIWTWEKGGKAAPNYFADMKGAASVAHIYGQNLAAAESLTSNSQFWAHAPSDLKPVIDFAFASGINLPIIHSSVHQPVDDKKPGLSLAIFGQFFNRHESWAEMAKPWIDYLTRSSYLLQQGRNVADLAYFYGEEAPLTELYRLGAPTDTPRHYGWDFMNADALLHAVRVEGGEVVSTGGARYKAIYLGGSSAHMTLPVLQRLADLVEAGATLIGEAPKSSPSLADDPAAFAQLRARLWPGTAVTPLGKGRVLVGRDTDAALAQAGIAPAFRFSGSGSTDGLMVVERASEDARIYFVHNPSGQAKSVEATFRVTDMQPKLWDANTGRAEALSYRQEGGTTTVPLALPAGGSRFVVFQNQAAEPSVTVTRPEAVPLADISKGWSVSFQAVRGAPEAEIKLDRLAPLNEHSDPAIRYFSGVATYQTQFRLPASSGKRKRLLLDLGSVGDLAEVRLNGKQVGTAWHAPWQLDIGEAAKAGTNTLEVRVANLWVNRLIGDAQPDAKKVAWTAIRTYGKDAPLRPSGLIGPVRILSEQDQPGR